MTTQNLEENVAPEAPKVEEVQPTEALAEGVVDEVKKETPPQQERTEVSPVKLNVEISHNPDFSIRSELIKAVFIQFGTEHSNETKWQLDQPQPGVLTLTSFVYPTMQFLFAEEAPEAAYVGIFPADDAAAVASLILSMRERLAGHNIQLGISGVIAPVIDGQQRRSLIAGMNEVYEITAVTSIERSRRLLRDMKERKDDGKEALDLEDIPAAQDEVEAKAADAQADDQKVETEAEAKPETDSKDEVKEASKAATE